MENKYNDFLKILEAEDLEKALMFILKLLDEGALVAEIYQNYLIPSLADFECKDADQEICIWKEHARTSIIRTILESSYKYLAKQKAKPVGKSIVVVCPQEEYHEIGAIIANNVFVLAGFKSRYIGANTPSEDIISAIRVLKPDYLALSVTDYYNLVVTKKLTEKIKSLYPKTKIIVGGQAFNQKEALRQVAYDFLLQTLDDIFKFAKEVR